MANWLKEAAEYLEGDLGLPHGFFFNLMKEDDWSFLVKLQALVETACTYLLVNALAQPSLEDALSRLEVADSKKGKLALIKGLGLLEEKDRKFIKELAEIRNVLVHNVRNVQFSLGDYLKRLNSNKASNLMDAVMGDSYKNQIKEEGKDPRHIFQNDPKSWFWLAALGLLGNIYMVKRQADLKQESKKRLEDYIDKHAGLRNEIFKQLLKSAI